jgi:hypothetical protein
MCFPGCSVPARWCEIHHVIAWADGGPTSVGNCVSLCGCHHRLIHHSDWHIDMAYGIPQFHLPPWLGGPSRRNPLHATRPYSNARVIKRQSGSPVMTGTYAHWWPPLPHARRIKCGIAARSGRSERSRFARGNGSNWCDRIVDLHAADGILRVAGAAAETFAVSVEPVEGGESNQGRMLRMMV